MMHEVKHAEKVRISPTHSFKYWTKNIRQLTTFASAIFTLIGCGMSMSFMFFSSINNWNSQEMPYLHYGGIIAGAILSSLLLQIFPKKFFYKLCSLLLILSGVFIIPSGEEFVGEVGKPLSIVLFLTGFIFSISVLTYITHCGEISTKYIRGSICSYIQFAIDLGLFIGITIIVMNNDNLTLSRNTCIITGTFIVITGFCAIVSACTLVYESPLFLLENGNEKSSIDILLKLRKETDALSPDIETELEDMRLILANKSNSLMKCSDIIPAFKVLLCRYAYLLASSTIITTTTLLLLDYKLQHKTLLMFFGKFISNFASIWAIDYKGRKNILITSITGSVSFLIVIFITISSSYYFPSLGFLITTLAFIYNIFLGFASSSVGYTYMSETFNNSRKTFINALIIILEYIPLILLNIFLNFEIMVLYNFLILCVVGLVQLLIGVLVIFFFPETKEKTLLEIQNFIKK